MAMTAQVKAELANTPVTKTCCRKSEVSSMLRFADSLHLVNGGIVVEAELDTGAAARRLRRDIAEVYGHDSEVVLLKGNGPAEMWVHVWPLLLFTAIVLAIGLKRFRRTLD